MGTNEDQYPVKDANGNKSGSEKSREPQNKRKSSTKKWVVVGVAAAVIIAAGAGFLVWHEQPGFCGTICHTPMQDYVDNYESGDPALLAAVHKGAEVSCLGCHEPTIEEQVMEGVAWVTGDYELPLEQRAFDDGFCLNEKCHDVSRESLAEATDHLKYNPHSAYHEQEACSDCHKAHETSVNACTQCHSDAFVPNNWKAYGE